jgi:hypothetical protein
MSSMPEVGPFATAIYDELTSLAYEDEENDWSLLRYLDALGQMFDEIEDLARDEADGTPGWSKLLDVDRTPAKALPWLAQFVGAELNPLPEAELREYIRAASNWKRGTFAAIRDTTQFYLRGSKTVRIDERDASPYHYTITVSPNEVLLRATLSDTLTTSGGLITDATRTTNNDGDGRTVPDSSFAIWEATTNIIENGGGETNTLGWTNGSACPNIARSTTQHKFGVGSVFSGILSGLSPVIVLLRNDNVTRFSVTAGNSYAFSLWALAATAGSTNFNIALRWFDAANAQISTTSMGVQPLSTAAFTRYAVVGVAPANAVTVQLRISWTAAANSDTVYFDGAQLESKTNRTPYVRTDGAQATRAAARVQAPAANLINATQSWMAFRVRLAWDTINMPGGNSYIFDWRFDANNLLACYFDITNKRWTIWRRGAAVGNTATTAVQTHAIGDVITVVVAWDVGNIKISINGGAFVSQEHTNIPSISTTLFDLGQQANSKHIDSQVLWATGGAGTLTDADAAALHANGDADPVMTLLGDTAQPTFVMPLVTSSFTYSGPDTTDVVKALNKAKPAGLQYILNLSTTRTYFQVKGDNPTYQDAKTAYPTYQNMRGG